MDSRSPNRVAFEEGLGKFVFRFPGRWFYHGQGALVAALFTGLLGFPADIAAYKVVGSLSTVWMVVWCVLIARRKGFLEYESGFVQVDALGRVRAFARWCDVVGVYGLEVNVMTASTPAKRTDYVLLTCREQIKFNDNQYRWAADFALRVNERAAAPH